MICARATQHFDLGLVSALGATRPAQSTTVPTHGGDCGHPRSIETPSKSIGREIKKTKNSGSRGRNLAEQDERLSRRGSPHLFFMIYGYMFGLKYTGA